MCRPLLSITAWHFCYTRELMSCIHQRIFSPILLLNEPIVLRRFLDSFPWLFHLVIPNILNMSGLWGGHSITVTSSSERNVLDFAVWHRALSCINTAGWLSTCFFNIYLYTVVLILRCSLTRSPLPATEIMPNTITLPPPNLTLLLMHWGEYCS